MSVDVVSALLQAFAEANGLKMPPQAVLDGIFKIMGDDEAGNEPLQPDDLLNSQLTKSLTALGSAVGHEQQRVRAVVEYVEKLPGFSATSVQPVVP